MYVGLTIILCNFIYVLLITYNYFSKERIKSVETAIYGYMLLVNILSLVFEFSSIIFVNNYESFYYESQIVNRGFLISVLLWVAFFTHYIYSISFLDDTKGNQKQKETAMKLVKPYKILIVIACIILILLPIEFHSNLSEVYSTGPATVFLSIVILLLIFVCIVFCIINYKFLKSKKYLPVFIFILFIIMTLIVRTMNPTLLLINLTVSFVTTLMYHTIENPDVKMLNEVKLAKEEAEHANRAKTDFLSSMSHEIRTPLNAIIAFSEEILKEDDLTLAKEDAKQVISSSRVLLETIGGILDISKIEAGSLEINRVEYNPKELFKTITDLINIKMKEKNIKFSMRLPADLPQNLYGDKVNIQKIIMNLLSNAYKYTEKGEVKFIVSCINQKKNCTLIIAVEDTGRGIKKENIDKLFTKFSRLEEDRNTTLEGTGLGLAITKKLVEMMSGKITVQSIYGSGSKFTVFLNQKIRPASTNIKNISEEAEIKDPLNIKYKDFSNKTVLVTDDNNINLKVAIKLLEKYNLNIIESNGGIDTINKIKAGNKYDLLLLDIEMPRFSGINVLKMLKEINFNAPIVALTANATTGDREKYLNLGFNEYLAKPIDRTELDRILNLYLSNGTEPVIIKNNPKVEMLNTKHNLSYLEASGADTKKAISILGDVGMFNETVEIVFDSTPNRLKRLEDYKNKKDMRSYSIEVHALKSDLKYIGFYELSEIPYNHEKESKNNNIDYIEQNFENLKETIINTMRICKKYLDK